MSTQPSSEDIISAIKKSGYLMEQHVASELESLGFHVETNYPFEDPDERKSREMDVRAIRRFAHNENAKLSAFIELIVECKTSANPFVFISRPKNQMDARSPAELNFPFNYDMRKEVSQGRSLVRSVDAFVHLGFSAIHYEYNTPSKAVQFCRIDRPKGKWEANHGGLYDGIFYPIAKAVAARRQELPARGPSTDWKYLWFLIPMVVTSGDLFEVDSSAQEIIPVGKDHISFQRQLRSGKLSGRYILEFVKQERLAGFISSCIMPLADLASDLVNNRSEFMLKKDIPWVEAEGGQV